MTTVVMISVLVAVGILYHIARTLERIETVLRDRLIDPDDDVESGEDVG